MTTHLSHSMQTASLKAHPQAWTERHFLPWHTQASQKSQMAPTIAIPEVNQVLPLKHFLIRSISSCCKVSFPLKGFLGTDTLAFTLNTMKMQQNPYVIELVVIPVVNWGACLIKQSPVLDMHLTFPHSAHWGNLWTAPQK